MSIKPKLIIYRSQRHHYVGEYNTVHGLLSSKLLCNDFNRLQYHRKRIYQAKGTKILRNINFNFSMNQSENDRLMKFITNFPMLDNLTIIFNFDIFQNSNYNEMKRILFKLTKQAKRVSKLNLFICTKSQTDSLFLKYLSSLKSIQNINITLLSSIRPLQALDDFLKLSYKRRTWQYLRNLTIEHAFYDLDGGETPSLSSIINTYRDLNKTTRETQTNLKIDLLSLIQGPMNDDYNLAGLRKGDIPNLTSLGFSKIDFNTLENSILIKLSETTSRLNSLELILDSQSSHNILKHLPHCLSKIQALRQLKLQVKNILDIHLVKEFANHLGICLQLRELSLILNSRILDNETLSNLGKSISSLINLKILDLKVQAPVFSPPTFDHLGIKILLDGISSLTGLEELSLNLSRNTVQWEQLEDLVNLRKLRLEFNSIDLDENNQILLGTTLPKLNKLESVTLIFSLGNLWSQPALTNLLIGLGRLNYLSYLKLILIFPDLNEIAAKTIMKMIWDLKALNGVDLLLWAKNKKEDAREYLKREFWQLNKRIKADFQG